jgi:hypothetical protein
MIADSLIAARVTADTKQRFAAVAHQQGLSESTLLKRCVGAALLAASALPTCIPEPVEPVGRDARVCVPGQLHNADFADSAFHCGRKSSDDRRDQRNKLGEPIRWHHEQKHGDRKFGKVLLKR